ncbi:MAG TPA: hypothetical protein VGZ51_09620 [Actinomycetota bacterium]|nr:hypothetical protein [Actinomycetota bacterium]
MAGAFRRLFADLFLLELLVELLFFFERGGVAAAPRRDAPALVAGGVAVFAAPSAF